MVKKSEWKGKGKGMNEKAVWALNTKKIFLWHADKCADVRRHHRPCQG
jgi:hypothetical protein